MTEYKPPPPDQKTNTLPSPSVAFNWEDWTDYLNEMDGTDAQKKELIETLWGIIIAFADLRWEIKDEVDKSSNTLDLSAALKAAVIQSRDQKQKEEV